MAGGKSVWPMAYCSDAAERLVAPRAFQNTISTETSWSTGTEREANSFESGSKPMHVKKPEPTPKWRKKGDARNSGGDGRNGRRVRVRASEWLLAPFALQSEFTSLS
jgi:hypothetical protein